MLIAGILTAGVALTLYLYFRNDVTQNQTPATANHERVTPGEQRSAVPQTAAPQTAAPQSTPPRTFTEQAPTARPAAAESAPVRHVRRPRVRQRSSSQGAAGTAPSTEEQNSQPTQSPSELANQNEPAQSAAVLQPPSSPSPSSPPVQPAVAPFAVLHATGKILLNGQLSDDSVISSGESIETPPDTYATLVREQSEILIKPSSKLTITEKGVELDHGDVLVTTPTGMPVQTSRLTITPSPDAHAKYEVLGTGESPQVKTYEGSVLVKE